MQISNLFKHATKLVSDNSPSILTALGSVGVVTTAIFASKGGMRALIDLSSADNPVEDMALKEVVLLTWRRYIPAAAMGGATIACIVSANTISTRRTAALVSVYSLTEKAFKEYKEKVVETIGKVKEEGVRDEVAKDGLQRAENKEVFITGTGEQLCFDSYTSRYFKSDIELIRKAQNDINEQLINFGYASQNEFYQMIGLMATNVGEEVGWTTENMMELEFSSVLTAENKPCLSIDYRVTPVRGYYKIN